jgi:hypothetical protein
MVRLIVPLMEPKYPSPWPRSDRRPSKMLLTSTLMCAWESLHSQKMSHKVRLEAFHVDQIDWARTVGNLKYYHWHDSRGHFTAVEKPGVLVGDI